MARRFPDNWDYERWRASVQYWNDNRATESDVDGRGGRAMFEQGLDPHEAARIIRAGVQRAINVHRSDLYPFCGATAEMFCFPSDAVVLAYERCSEPERPAFGCYVCPLLLYAVRDGSRRYEWVAVDDRGRVTRLGQPAGTRAHRQACGVAIREDERIAKPGEA